MERSDKIFITGPVLSGNEIAAEEYSQARGFHCAWDIFAGKDWLRNSKNHLAAFKYLLDHPRPRRKGSAGQEYPAAPEEVLKYLEDLTEFQAGLVAQGHRRDEVLDLSRQMGEAERVSLSTNSLFSDPTGTIIRHYPIGETIKVLASIPAISDRFCADLNELTSDTMDPISKRGAVGLIADVLTQLYCRILFEKLLLHTTWVEYQREALKEEKFYYKRSTTGGPYNNERFSYFVWNLQAVREHLVKCLAECSAISENDIAHLASLYETDASYSYSPSDDSASAGPGLARKFEGLLKDIFPAKGETEQHQDIVEKFRDHIANFLQNLNPDMVRAYTEVPKRTDVDFRAIVYYNANSFDLEKIYRLMEDVAHLHQAGPAESGALARSIQNQG